MENLWDNGFTAGKYEIIDLSLQNQVGLDILSKYFMSLLVKKDAWFYMDNEKIEKEYEAGTLDIKLKKAQKLLIEVLGQEFTKKLTSSDIIFVIPSLDFEINQFKLDLKKK